MPESFTYRASDISTPRTTDVFQTLLPLAIRSSLLNERFLESFGDIEILATEREIRNRYRDKLPPPGDSLDCLQYMSLLTNIRPDKIMQTIFDSDPVPMQENTFAMYFDDEGNWKHIGIVLEGGIIESKWGPLSVYRHPVGIVPQEYGNTVIFFKLPTPN